MRIRKVEGVSFMRWGNVEVALPATGVVLLQGANGHGKSTIIEAISHALWGKSVRGAPGWRKDEAGGVRVELDGLTVHRSVSAKGSAKLRWSRADGSDGAANYATRTASQAKLEELVGTHDVWARSCVFSSHEAGSFTTLTDKGRKELLERMLALEPFAVAYKSATRDRTVAAQARDRATHELALHRARVTGKGRELAQVEEAIEGFPDEAELAELRRRAIALAEQVEASERELAELQGNAERDAQALQTRSATARAELEKRHHDAQREHDKAQHAVALARESCAVASARVADLEARQASKRELGPTCPTCEQGIPHDHRDAIFEALDIAVEVAEGKRTAAENEVSRLVDELAAARKSVTAIVEEAQALAHALEEERSGILGRARGVGEAIILERDGKLRERASLVGQGKALRARLEQREPWLAKGETLRAELDRLEAETQALEVRERDTIREHAELDAVCSVLGLRGVRASILAQALETVESVANDWLARLGYAHLRVKLSPQSTTAAGKVRDVIDFAVEGAGGGYGYKASSGGERRRIDIAILLALADVAVGQVAPDSTLFVDEIFDALDSEGVEATVAAVEELARERCVVIITHNPQLVDQLPSAQRYRVQGGSVEPV